MSQGARGCLWMTTYKGSHGLVVGVLGIPTESNEGEECRMVLRFGFVLKALACPSTFQTGKILQYFLVMSVLIVEFSTLSLTGNGAPPWRICACTVGGA